MTFKCILIIAFLFSFLSHYKQLTAEESHPLIVQAEKFYLSENYEACITESLRFLCFEPNHPHVFYARFKAGMASKKLGKMREAEKYFMEAILSPANRDLKMIIRHQLSLSLISQFKFNLAKLELFKLTNNKTQNELASASRLLLGLIYVYENNIPSAIETFSETNVDKLNSGGIESDNISQIIALLNRQIKNPQEKSLKLAQWLSTFAPGSGQIYSGEFLNGLNALALNTTNTYFLWATLREKKVRDATLIFSMLWYRYYQGNRFHAKEAAMNANLTAQKQLFSEIFKEVQQESLQFSNISFSIRLEDLKAE